ncbi:hypothetical protein INT45_009627 [Circinella minor]|uniref:SbsA Ig-like domain-containing protein n=1 Tax=Circinella minor TaxID=1195481 RepID=A0A8H7S9F6_9FUNG|nr:hypothetical protein INT45_009627 [Circinella minor]
MIFSYLKIFFILAIASLSVVAQDDDTGDIIYPTPKTVWRVGQHVNVTFSDEVPEKETVSIFFSDARQTTLGGGPLGHRVFYFTVPAAALSGPDSTSLLLAVRRTEDRRLASVDAVNVRVIPEID